jgi:hypothetical protein
MPRGAFAITKQDQVSDGRRLLRYHRRWLRTQRACTSIRRGECERKRTDAKPTGRMARREIARRSVRGSYVRIRQALRLHA